MEKPHGTAVGLVHPPAPLSMRHPSGTRSRRAVGMEKGSGETQGRTDMVMRRMLDTPAGCVAVS